MEKQNFVLFIDLLFKKATISYSRVAMPRSLPLELGLPPRFPYLPPSLPQSRPCLLDILMETNLGDWDLWLFYYLTKTSVYYFLVQRLINLTAML